MIGSSGHIESAGRGGADYRGAEARAGAARGTGPQARGETFAALPEPRAVARNAH